ncbi:ABC transporter ATP-binding protein [Candidatus Mycosynbacter amalyticus]|uniref:ABC transporter ATP-binding protein n=1 Tax=Candidatus Mycosynbacter amalyticus TaxID=2665156 RepID=UPI0021B3322C|nr:ABC transporter ATP-binding protein [Candidatus Mycosynbacter amalyticus]
MANIQKTPAIVVEDLSKTFRIPTEQSSGIKQAIINRFRGVKGYREFSPLQNVSFTINEGDFFGIVGRNGSGKSTLLKLLAGIYEPNGGSIQTKGTLVPFIELGVGFNPELTGRENVFLNGALLGFSHTDMAKMYDDIVEFAELGDFMEERLKNYSSGMQVRLAFSIAIRADGDILLLDEVLAVGDEAFQRKCNEYFLSLKKRKKTVILVTHDMGAVTKYCTKALLIEKGKIKIEGNPEDVANQYVADNLPADVSKSKDDGKYETGLSKDTPVLRNVAVSKKVVTSDDVFRFSIEYTNHSHKKVYAAFSLLDVRRGGVVYDSGSIEALGGKQTLTFDIPLKWFNSGDFKIISSLRDGANPKKAGVLGFTSDVNSAFFSIRNKGEKSDYALLNGEELQVKRL